MSSTSTRKDLGAVRTGTGGRGRVPQVGCGAEVRNRPDLDVHLQTNARQCPHREKSPPHAEVRRGTTSGSQLCAELESVRPERKKAPGDLTGAHARADARAIDRRWGRSPCVCVCRPATDKGERAGGRDGGLAAGRWWPVQAGGTYPDVRALVLRPAFDPRLRRA